jgi:glucosamine--fructose-6-phosphate aminotransferase (isomerizing)
MCGIIGYLGQDMASPIICDALKKLEYRGYDSIGMATIAYGQVYLRKGVGNIDQVSQRQHFDSLPGTIGIGHTRWATHGAVTANNAHPHSDCTGQVVVVHNGIIQNYQKLRAELSGKHKFESETDTEVIPHLIEDYLKAGSTLEEAVLSVTKVLEGSYAIAVISSSEPGKLVAARKDSPLVVGLNGTQKFVASDGLCFLDKCQQVAFMEDNEVVVLDHDGVRFFNAQGQEINREPVTANWEWGEVSRQGYDFYMLKEILEEPQSVYRALIQDEETIREIAMDILRARNVVITGSGSSRYASIIGRYLFSKQAGKLCEVIMSSEFQYFADSIDRSTLVIAVSQSGETADTVCGVRIAREKGARILSIVNVVGSTLARLSHNVLYLNCGPEIGVAATKSFIAQLSIFYLLSFAMMNRLKEGSQKLEAISGIMDTSYSNNTTKIIDIARMTKHARDFYYIARGINFAIAGEASLKLKEVSYVHAEGMSAGELKHGTLALVQRGTPVVAICPKDYTYEETLANAAECKARGALIIGVSDEGNSLFDEWIPIPSVEELFYPMISIVPLHLFAYQVAICRSKNPDRPRNLAKSVTVK